MTNIPDRPLATEAAWKPAPMLLATRVSPFLVPARKVMPSRISGFQTLAVSLCT